MYTQVIGLALGSGLTGIAADLRAQLLDTVGANVGSAISTGFAEVGAGNYIHLYAAFPDGFRGGVKYYRNTGGAVVAFAAINPEEVENPDVKTSAIATALTTIDDLLDTEIAALTASLILVKAKTDLIGVASVSITSYYAVDGGTISLLGGDDYHAGESRKYEVTDTGNTWPDLTGATVTFYAENDNYGVAFTKVMTIVTPSGALKKIETEFTAANTTTLRGQGGTEPGSTVVSAFTIRAALATVPVRTVTLVRGSISVTMVADGVNA